MLRLSRVASFWRVMMLALLALPCPLRAGADVAAPTITSFSPTHVYAGEYGDVVTITGTHFTVTTQVTFSNNGFIVDFTVVNDTTIRATTPEGVQTGWIAVTTPGGTAYSENNFTVNPIPAPTITSFTPTSTWVGEYGQTITIKGTYFTGAGKNPTGATQVTFGNNGFIADFTVVDATTIHAILPDGVQTGRIAVTTSGGTAWSDSNFTVNPIPAPTITSFTPTSTWVGEYGQTITIKGTYFTGAGINPTGATQVTFGNNGFIADFTVVDATTIHAILPDGVQTGCIAVTTSGGTAWSDSNFTVNPIPAPTITSFTPTSTWFGEYGQTITIKGTYFTGAGINPTGATQVTFGNGGYGATFTVVDANTIHAILPDGVQNGQISVTTAGGTAWSNDNFTVNPIPAPTITSFTPTSTWYGEYGQTITIKGTYFTGAGKNPTGANQVTFGNGGYGATFTVVDATTIHATLPDGVQTGQISVTTSGGTAWSNDNFTVNPIPAPTITSFTPNSCYVGEYGQKVTITGTYFKGAGKNPTGATSVTFNGNSADFTVISDTTIEATVPTGIGDGPLSATTSGGTAWSAEYFRVLPLPEPILTSFTPTSGNAGDIITIHGDFFVGVLGVKFNDLPCTTFTVNNRTTITATVPSGNSVGKISVTTPSGTVVSTGNFTFSYTWHSYNGNQYALTSSRLSWLENEAEAVSLGGHLVTIETAEEDTWLSETFNDIYCVTYEGQPFGAVAQIGYCLNSGNAMWISGKPMGYTHMEDPVGIYGYMSVNPHPYAPYFWGMDDHQTYGIIERYVPAITSFTPDRGKVGDTVTIAGKNFTGTTSVKFNGTTATFTVVNDTSITVKVPTGATTGKIAVTSPAGTATSATNFIPAPVISSFTPTFGKVGDSVTIAGLNFTGATAVKFNGTTAVFTVVSATSITATVPAGATIGKITVTTPSGTATSATDFIAAPTITSLTPTFGKVGDSVTIAGTNFTGATAVKFNGTTAVFTVVSATSITTTVPSGATTGKITVTTPGGTATSATDYTVYFLPTISSFTPSFGKVGDSVTITGTNFMGTTGVKFNGTAAVFTIVSATSITTTVPSGATTGKITVTTPGGTATSASDYTVYYLPTITSFTPTFGKVGDSVTIAGTNFTGATAVKFNGTTAVFTVVSATSITTTVPSGATTGKITVTTPGGTATSASDYTVYFLPTITSFTPTFGKVGDSVTITGTNSMGTTGVKFNGTAAVFTVVSATSITTTVPSGATTGKITVTTPVGTATSASDYTVYFLPTITSFTPTFGKVGDSVTITGTNFVGTTAVKFNGTTAVFTVVSATSITTTVPSGATTGKITVTTPGGTATSATNYTVYFLPTITSFTPTFGKVGDSVTITGTKFVGTTAVKFNGTTAVFTVVSATSITTTVPSGATTGKIAVTTPGGTATSASDYTVYQPVSLVVTVAPGEGYIGPLSSMALNYSLVGAQTYTGTFTFNSSGKATITGLRPGVYSLSISGSHWLKRTVAGVNVNGVNGVNTNLTNGDADGGNSINLFDFVQLDMHFGSNFAMADLDGDGLVNLFDYVIIDQNFGALGDL
ncbi:MAG: IPT/TIG domain-containing protein [Armatimonadota bacterium]